MKQNKNSEIEGAWPGIFLAVGLFPLIILTTPARAQQGDLTFTDGFVTDGVRPDLTAWPVQSMQAIDVEVINFGPGDTGTVTLQFYLSLDAVITPEEDIPVGQAVMLGPLDRMKGLALGLNLIVPAAIAADTYFLGAIIDVDNDESETDEGNNVAVSSEVISVVADPLASPENVVGDTVATTPYIAVDWTPPVNNSAPELQGAAISDMNEACLLADQNPGRRFRLEADFANDPEGDVLQGQAGVRVFVDQFFFGVQTQVENVAVQNGGGSGTVVADVCVAFGVTSSLDVPFHITDAAGNSSNILTVTIFNPDAGKGQAVARAPHTTGGRKTSPHRSGMSQQDEAGQDLMAYNIYRRLLGTPEAYEELLATVPASRTDFVDEFSVPLDSYTYRVAAVYAVSEGPREGFNITVPNVNDVDLFRRRTFAGLGKNSAASGIAQLEDNDPSLGGAWGDFDGDGELDLFVVNYGAENALLVAEQGRFKITSVDEVTSTPCSLGFSCSMGASWGDFDNDGDLDLFVANTTYSARLEGQQENFLYRNERGRLVLVSDLLLDAIGGGGKGNSESGSWGDYNNDGHLDLFVANTFEANFLYRNKGDGTFERITFGDSGDNSGVGVWGDYDNDGNLDLYVANLNSRKNRLYRNLGPDNKYAFQEVGRMAGVDGEANDSPGASWGDFNNDGYLDLFVTNFGGTSKKNYLYQNLKNGSFTRLTPGDIGRDEEKSLGSAWGDYDNDGDLDLLVMNFTPPNALYRNDWDTGRVFTRITEDNIGKNAGRSTGASWGDFTRDGFLDIFVANQGSPNLLYENNRGNNTNNFVSVRCVGTQGNASVIGAKVRVRAQIGNQDRWQMREISGQTGRGGQNNIELIFGLGDATQIDEFIVEWPSGGRTEASNIDVRPEIFQTSNRLIVVREGSAIQIATEEPASERERFFLYANYPNPFAQSTNIRFDMPKPADVTLTVYNLLGKKITTVVDRFYPAGRHEVVWQVGGLAGGVYLYRLQAGDFVQTQKLLLIK